MARKPQQNRAKMTVDAIVQASIQLIAEQGVGFITTAKIAERAGVSIGSLYEYFDNKEQIIDAATAHLAGDAINAVQEMTPDILTMKPREAVREILIRMRIFVEKDDSRYLLFIRNSMAHGEVLNLDLLNLLLRDIALQYLMTQTPVAKQENLPAKLYILTNGGIYTYITYLADPNPPITFDALVDGLVDLVISQAAL